MWPGAATAGAGNDHLERADPPVGYWWAQLVEGLFDQSGEVGVVLGAFKPAGAESHLGASCRVRPAAKAGTGYSADLHRAI